MSSSVAGVVRRATRFRATKKLVRSARAKGESCDKDWTVKPFRDYNAIAWVYKKHWGPRFAQRVLPAMEKISLRRLGVKSTVAGLCCGTGNFGKALADRGLSVIGLNREASISYLP